MEDQYEIPSQKAQTQVVKGSLSDVAKSHRHQPCRNLPFRADVIVLVDTSSSMEAHDAPGGKSRYDAACTELSQPASHHPR
jgi:hypothetical protein